MRKIIVFMSLFLVAHWCFAQNNPSAPIRPDDTIQKVVQTKELQASLRKNPIDNQWTDRAKIIKNEELTIKNGENNSQLLWYREPAKVWEEALPLGNGHLGAMVFGGVADERIQLNENTLWDGYPVDPNNPKALAALPEVQRLLFENKNNEAVKLAGETMMGIPAGVKSYQSLGELWFDTPETQAENYIRSLDLSTAVAATRYQSGGVAYTREYFASAVDNVIVVRITADKKNKINLSLALRREKDARSGKVDSDPSSMLLSGQINAWENRNRNAEQPLPPEGVSFAAQVKAVAENGSVQFVNDPFSQTNLLQVKDADILTLYIAGATNYPGMKNLAAGNGALTGNPQQTCADLIAKAIQKPYDQLKAAHIADHRKYFSRMELNLGETPADVEALPTDERLALARKTGTPDAGLVEKYFQFGRYLLIASSRPGGMPANLQGLWAWQMNAPWNADFHTNINLQMNYWPVEIANLSELHLPLFDLSDMLVKPGEKSAQVIYGARGWVVHHLTDAWGFTAPADGPQGIWPMGSAWLAQHPWEHYAFTGDREFLADRAYPLMKGAARFIMDFLVEAPAGTAYAGKLVTNPSYSPENAFILPNGDHSVFTYGATMDLEIIHNLLTNCIAACKILKIDDEFRAECEKTLKRLPAIQISRETGRILEWAEDYKEVEPNHRHTSHLFGLYPGNQITVVGTPVLAEAARKTLIARGDDGTGWGLAWKINMWNRLHDGDHAYKLLSVLLSQKTLPNLFDDHPPFQIDGNFGATAAIAEMLVQSQLTTSDGSFDIYLLPSLPTAFATGSVKGIRARGGFTLDLSWKDGKLAKARILSGLGGKLHLRTLGKKVTIHTKKGEIVVVNGDLKKQALYLDDTKPIEERIEDALSRMTLREKVAMVHAQSKFSSPGVPRLGIPENWMTDGPHGIRAEVLWDEWNQAGWTSDSCTAFPALTCLAASWNPEIAASYGKSIGEEARYRNKNVLLGPGVNIYRTPLNGRNFEYMGEDPFLASRMVVPYVQGVQSNGIAACVKHFALNNQEVNRHTVDVSVDDRALYELYLPAFKAAMQEGGAWAIMGAYNRYKGQWACQNQYLLNDILRGEWGFDGVVISDWGGVNNTEESIYQGVDMEFGTWTNGLSEGKSNAYDSYFLADPFLDLILSGKVKEAEVDKKVRNILRLVFRTTMNRNRPFGSFATPEHSEAGRKIAEEGMVLLKNNKNVLPIDLKQTRKILVVGENAIKMMTIGGGSSSLKAKYEISPLDGIKNRVGSQAEVVYARGYVGESSAEQDGLKAAQNLKDTRTPGELTAEAVKEAQTADCVIFIGGLNKHDHQDCEGADRLSLDLPYGQDALISELAKANKNMVVVIISGNAVSMPWINEVPAIVEAWYSGSEAGTALARVLAGDVNPSGKLPFTFPVKLTDVGAHAMGDYPGDKTETYKESFYVGYRWNDKNKIKALFPFGHGLSYTTFTYGKAVADKSKMTNTEKITFSIPVKNTGVRAGAEIVQLYISDKQSSLPRPVKELKGFQKIYLNPGEEKTVSITIDRQSLSFFDDKRHQWVAEPGQFEALIGSSSVDIKAKVLFELQK